MMDVHGWSAALKLSTMWGFQEIRDKAILELDGMLPIQKISMGIEYRVQKWLLDGYGELIRREENLLEAEARELGFETAWRIGKVREETIVKVEPGCYNYQDYCRNFGDLEAQIRTVFGDQFKDAEYMRNDLVHKIEERTEEKELVHKIEEKTGGEDLRPPVKGKKKKEKKKKIQDSTDVQPE